MNKRLFAMTYSRYKRVPAEKGDKVIYVGSEFYKKLVKKGAFDYKCYAVSGNLMAVKIDKPEDVVFNSKMPGYKRYRVIKEFIDKYKYNTNNCCIFIVDGAGGRLAGMIARGYEASADFSDRALLGLALPIGERGF